VFRRGLLEYTVTSESKKTNKIGIEIRPVLSVVDPDPDPAGSETISRKPIRKKSFRVRNEFEVKLL
jgi:hypothetical protein